jgi:hypothetical protein
MTPEDFRKSTTLCAELKALTESRAFRIGCEAVLHQFIARDVIPGAPEVASVRFLTQRVSYELAFRELATLHEAGLVQPPDKPDDWGEPEAAARLHGEDLPLPYQGPVQPEIT